jgi:exodeoxyribonuclease VII small subunit
MKQTTMELQAELENILAWFESDEVEIDKAAEQYERGLQIAKELQARLKQTENAITKLTKSFAE